jgi:hypothetical protein
MDGGPAAGGVGMTDRLVWQKQPDGSYAAVCGEEGQGRVVVACRNLAWEWSVDMLPDDAEPKIRSGRSCASAFDAMAAAQRQVAAWPVLVDGARR